MFVQIKKGFLRKRYFSIIKHLPQSPGILQTVTSGKTKNINLK